MLERILTTFFLLALLISCESLPSFYLEQGLNRITQQDVVKKLGPPGKTQELAGGRSVWIYRKDCVDYVLTFDQEKVLREWDSHLC